MTVNYKGVSFIDAILDSRLFSLSGNTGVAGSATYTFNPAKSFRSGTPALGGQVATIMTSDQKNEMTAAMQEWKNVANLSFSINDTTPSIVFSQLDPIPDNPASKGRTYVIDTNDKATNTDLFLEVGLTGYQPGGEGHFLALHELGHALGLDHPGGNPLSLDHSKTLMSYNPVPFTWQVAASPMIYDIAAAQYLYGANTSYNSGNTIYGGPDNIGPYHVRFDGTQKAWTIWDAGGTEDVFDFSGSPSNRNLKLDLRGGVDDKGTATLTDDVVRFSEIGDERIAIAFDPSHYNTDGSLKPGKSGVVDIEKAIGGAGDDTIIGGYVANTLQGGAGNDKVYDPSSKSISGDWLYGDAPGSTLAGGNDTLWGGSNTFLYGGSGDDTVWMNESTAYHQSGADTYIAYSGLAVYRHAPQYSA